MFDFVKEVDSVGSIGRWLGRCVCDEVSGQVDSRVKRVSEPTND